MNDDRVRTLQTQGEGASFRSRVEEQLRSLRRMQMICLPAILVAVIGMILTWGAGGAALALFRVMGLDAFLGEMYCFCKARNLTCPKCHNKVAYLLQDPSYSRMDGALLLPKGLPSGMHQCPYCNADWERAE